MHVADNDEDVNIEEGMQLVDALRARKPSLAETQGLRQPAGGHLFDRRVDPATWQPENTPEQRDSWSRVWAFLDRTWNRHDGGGTSSSRTLTVGGRTLTMVVAFVLSTWASSAVGSAHEWHS